MNDRPNLASRLPDSAEPSLVFDRFLEHVQASGLSLYPAQEEALLEMLEDKNIILNTPTGSGKSLVATAMHFKALAEGKTSFYTSPVKALVNEKFFALCDEFGPDNVGLMTGDATVNRDAPLICCTAEILANMALRFGEIADVDYAILDEFHYYADRDRGVAWQIPLLCLPQTTFLLMSATLGDVSFFQRALSELNGKPTAVVRSTDRPVPLDFAYYEVPLHVTVATLLETARAPVYLVSFTHRDCHAEAQNLMSVDVCTREQKKQIAEELRGFRFDTPQGKDLERFVRHGVGLHHGGLLPKYRRLVERLSQKGLLRVISGTDTLGVGVNIPIRTVVLTKLCKFDGEHTKILTAREFHQISGRAGRKGFDDRGSVVALAPEHVIENKRLEAKAAASGKGGKLVRKKPPQKGYVHWDKGTFERLRESEAEPLVSRFQVSHAMLVNVLGRDAGGCRAMKDLVRRCHERPHERHVQAKLAISMFGSLVRAGILELVPRTPDDPRGVRVNADLQFNFSLNQTLSLFLIETLPALDPEAPGYAYDVLSLVESILENPTLILRRQLDRLKGELVAELKAAGVEYDERMAELEKLEYPKPNRDFIYSNFDDFAARHPWVGTENIRPKGIARELYEQYLGFNEAVRHFELSRAEHLLLRYVTETYKVLAQTVPATAHDTELEDMIAYFHGMVRGVDSSLLDEWEKLRDPSYLPRRPEEPGAEEPPRPPDLTTDPRAFTVLLRNAIFRFVRALACGDFAVAADLVVAPTDADPWTPERLDRALRPYREEHGTIRTDASARGTVHTEIDRSDARRWRVRQVLVDPDEHCDFYLALVVDLDRAVAEGVPVLELAHLGN